MTRPPAHGNYNQINVEEESKEEDSILNAIQGLIKIHKTKQSLQKGSLELIEGLPNGVLGYAREFKEEKITVLLNFDSQEKEFQIKFSECIFKLSDKDNAKEKAIRLNGFGGMMLKAQKDI